MDKHAEQAVPICDDMFDNTDSGRWRHIDFQRECGNDSLWMESNFVLRTYNCERPFVPFASRLRAIRAFPLGKSQGTVVRPKPMASSTELNGDRSCAWWLDDRPAAWAPQCVCICRNRNTSRQRPFCFSVRMLRIEESVSYFCLRESQKLGSQKLTVI